MAERYVVTRAQSAKGNRYELQSATRRPGIGRLPRTTHIAQASAMRALCGVRSDQWPSQKYQPQDATCRRCGQLYRAAMSDKKARA